MARSQADEAARRVARGPRSSLRGRGPDIIRKSVVTDAPPHQGAGAPLWNGALRLPASGHSAPEQTARLPSAPEIPLPRVLRGLAQTVGSIPQYRHACRNVSDTVGHSVNSRRIADRTTSNGRIIILLSKEGRRPTLAIWVEMHTRGTWHAGRSDHSLVCSRMT
jgi:hypothetical protein